MKKTIKFFAAALAIVAAASCAKENPENTQSGVRDDSPVELVDFHAEVNLSTTGGSSTKTSLATDMVSVNWSANDALMVFPYKVGGGDAESPYKGSEIKIINESINGTAAQFSGSAQYASNYVAVYPFKSFDKNNCYNNRWAFQKETLRKQNIVNNNFPTVSWGTAHIALANSCQNGTIFDLKNQLAYLKFSVNYDNIYSIEVSASAVSAGENRNLESGKNLGGTLYYRPAKQSFNINSGDYPIIANNNNQAFEKGVTYYIALPAVEASELSMTGKDANNNIIFSKTKQSNLDIQANTIYNLGTFGESTSAGEDVQINPYAEAVHKTDSYGNIIGTDVKIYIQPTDASKIKDFSFSASIDNYRSLYTSNPNDVAIMTVLNDNRYLPRGDKGYYFITYEYSVNGNKKEPKYLRVDIPEPQFNITSEVTSAYEYYLAGNTNMANNTNSNYVKLNKVSVGIDDYVVDKNHINVKVEFNQETINQERNRSFLSINKEYSLNIGSYVMTTSVTFDGVTETATKEIHVTGLPLKGYECTLNSNQELTVNVNAPKNINVDVNLDAYLYGYNSKSYIAYTLYFGDQTFSDTTQGYAYKDKTYQFNGADAVIKANSSIKMESAINGNEQGRYVHVKKFDVLYR